MPTTSTAVTQRAFAKLDAWRGESAKNERAFHALADKIANGSTADATAAAKALAKEVGVKSADVFLRPNIHEDEIVKLRDAETTMMAQVSDSDIPDPKLTPFHAKLKQKLDDADIYSGLETPARLLTGYGADSNQVAAIQKAIGQSLLDAPALAKIQDGIQDAYSTYFDNLRTSGDWRDDARIGKARGMNNWYLKE